MHLSSLIWQLSQSPNICQFGPVSPPALDDVVNKNIRGEFRINLGIPNRKFITASAAVIVDSFSLVFVAYVNTNGSFITGVSSCCFTAYSHDCIDPFSCTFSLMSLLTLHCWRAMVLIHSSYPMDL